MGGKLLGAGEAADVPHFEGDHHRQDEPHAGQGHEAGDLGRRPEDGLHPALEGGHLAVEGVDLLQHLLGGVRGVLGELGEARLQQRPAPRGERIADREGVEGVLGEGGVDPILEAGALADEHHPGARQLALVAQRPGGDPDRG
jgi:hypothetical protein